MARIALGNSDFRTLRRAGALYVDKTAAIAGLVDSEARVTLYCRPRRFGKTLFLSTLRYFLEASEEDRSDLFEGLAVWQSPEARIHFQRYPVLWFSFKEVKGQKWADVWEMLVGVLQRACEPFAALETDARLSERER